LDFWRAELGYNPWHFWGLADATIQPVTSKCNDVIREYAWQENDQAGRKEIRDAIETAEKILLDQIGYRPAPFYTEDTLPWPRYHDQKQYRLGRRDVRGGWIPVQLNEGYIQDTGIEAFTLIDGRATLVYTDEDGDGLDETFTITVATTVTDPGEIAIYFDQGDRLDEDDALSARWRIEPVNVVISGGNATIKGKSWLVVKPVLYEDEAHYPIDPTVATNFITDCDVYRRYTYKIGQNSGNSQSALIWESRPCWWGCDDCGSASGSTDPASVGLVAGRCGVRDSYNGIVVPAEAVYNSTTGYWSHPCDCLECCGEPDRVLVRYLAGLDLDSLGHMQKTMRTLVTRLAAAEMSKRICACDQANREWSNWQFDVSRVNGPEQYQYGLDVFNNPLGTRRGHIYAWQQIKQLARPVGMLA
jgi:hypothetical protein